ncbi:fem-1 [Symbiodinium sp. CCMP2456]|nr:fem-1 [Symbiodinium sp. CCMP2456]
MPTCIYIHQHMEWEGGVFGLEHRLDLSSTRPCEEHPPMVQIVALSDEALAELDKDMYARMVEDGRSVEDLKQALATETGFSRFQQRLLADGTGQSEDNMPLASTARMQLVMSDFAFDERSQKALMRACRNKRADKVEKLLQEAQDPNEGGGNIPIHAAAMSGDLEVLQLLVEARADINGASRGKTALDLAVGRGEIHGYFHVFQFLVESGAYANGYHLFVAAFCGSLEALELFLQARADRNYALEHYPTPLHLAAEPGCSEMVRLPAEAGADIDAAIRGLVCLPPWVLMPTLTPACKSMPAGNAVRR